MTDDDHTTTYYVALYGRCQGNTGPGFFTATIHDTRTKEEWSVSGNVEDTTANRMEQVAALRALETLEPGQSVTMGSGSEYLIKGMRDWLPGWKAKGWRGANRKQVLNADLWRDLDEAVERQGEVRWEIGKRG
ncbi:MULTISPECIES: RNase H family protein [Methylobacterium]|uniref:Ribonuclease HI n=2 Tax=Pseudomonadota TaxID=1224 RepID=A0ABQ4SVD0_9HYPH|nr:MULTISPECIES: RNase H family protein [Methylobacterium]PIU05166.1 MAG: ribonuclease HI [Methylobacterium sp. CG09_land_8_20_14_0_10_71_15]PIU16341.1 MAG: ribonuclease HI [Methylobacterium sp. CG08_land_8_20_14_0_20_71_15]GBU19869.1 ribonuclease HI [Methylobacterium sp.]GJE06460.1 Ribonuclease HI [Methylobacterium jeotgali]